MKASPLAIMRSGNSLTVAAQRLMLGGKTDGLSLRRSAQWHVV
jgi:hypothetical protein